MHIMEPMWYSSLCKHIHVYFLKFKTLNKINLYTWFQKYNINKITQNAKFKKVQYEFSSC